MSRTRWTAGLALAAGLALLGWAWLRAPEPPAAPEPARSALLKVVVEAPVPPGAPLPEADAGLGLLLRATLEGDGPFQGEARVGAAFISESDVLAWEEARRDGARTGPSRREDLANVAKWEPAPVTPSAGGGVLGPVPVPPAPRYRVLAWQADGTFWWGDLVPSELPSSGVLDVGVLRASRPTGVRVRLVGARPEHGSFSVRLERGVSPVPEDAERASELLPVVRHVSPRLAAALQDGTPVPVSSDSDTPLLPLLPDPSVRLWLRDASGQEGGPVEVPLREGRVEVVTLDVERLFLPGARGTVTLRGRVLLGGSSRPPPGAVVELPGGGEQRLDSEGRFTVSGLPSWQPSRFAVRVEPPVSGRPVVPPRWEFEFSPRAGVTEAEETWRVPAYRWLVLAMDGFTRGQLEARARPPYPVYVLQRRAEDGTWRGVAADAFLPEERGMTVSVVEPGTYRVLAAASPYELHPSPSARVGVEDSERAVSLRLGEEGVTCEVRVTEGGRPVYGALVTAVGESGSLPPLRGRTDAEGRWPLGRVLAGSLQVEVEAEGHAVWTREAIANCQQAGVVEVRL